MVDRTTGPKELFIVHTRGELWHRATFELIEDRLAQCEFLPWKYADWDWHHLVDDGLESDFSSQGFEIDPFRFVTRDPEPFITAGESLDVNRDLLRRLMMDSCVILVFEPSAGRATSGIKEEIIVMQRAFKRKPKHPPILISVQPAGSGRSILPADLPIGAVIPLADPNKTISSSELNRILTMTSLAIFLRLLTRKTTPAVGSFLLTLVGHHLPTLSDIIRCALLQVRIDLAAAERESKSREAWLAQERQSTDWRMREAVKYEENIADIIFAVSSKYWKEMFRKVELFIAECGQGDEQTAFSRALSLVEEAFDDAWSRLKYHHNRSVP